MRSTANAVTDVRGTAMALRAVQACRALLALLLLAGAVHADVIHYKDGRSIEGVITARTSTEITVKTDFGSVVVPLSKVARIEEKRTPAQELQARRTALPAGDAAALFELALWARDAELTAESRALLREVIALAPTHALANEALGRRLVDDRWLEPSEVDAYLREREAEQRAAGLLWDDGRWLPEAEVMARRGFVRVHGEWVPRRQGETTLLLEDLAAIDIPLRATTGTHLTLFSELPADEAEALVHNLDQVVKDLLLRWPPTEAERAWLVGDAIPVLAPPDLEAVGRLMDSEVLERYGATAAFRREFRAARGFVLYWPRALLGVAAHDASLEAAGDADLGRLAVLGHQLAHLLVQRFKGGARAPGWVEAGLAAFYEGALTQHATVTITGYRRGPDGATISPYVRGWEGYTNWHEHLLRPEGREEAGGLDALMAQDVADLDSREIGLSWSVVRYLMESRGDALLAYLRAYDTGPEASGKEAPLLHRLAWQSAFGEELDEVERGWEAWAEQQPPIVIPPRLLSQRR